MFKHRIVQIALLTGLIVVALTGSVLALSKNKNVGGTNNKSIYEFGQTVDVDGTVNGDVFCAGQTVNINATVNGDVICAAQTIDISGRVIGSVRLVAQTIDISGSVGRAVSTVSQDFNLDSKASVGQDVSLLSESANLNGSVGRDVSVRSGNVYLNGPIGRNFSGHVSKLTLYSGSRLNGSLTYSSGQRLTRRSGAVVVGPISYSVSRASHRGGAFGWRIGLAVILIIFSLVLSAILPGFFRRLVKVSRGRFWLSLLVGLLSIIVLPAIMVALAVTIIGSPLAALMLLIWLAILMLSLPVSAYLIGSLTRRTKHAVLNMLIGAVILAVLLLVPYLNILVGILAVLIGSGSILIDLKQYFKRPFYN